MTTPTSGKDELRDELLVDLTNLYYDVRKNGYPQWTKKELFAKCQQWATDDLDSVIAQSNQAAVRAALEGLKDKVDGFYVTARPNSDLVDAVPVSAIEAAIKDMEVK